MIRQSSKQFSLALLFVALLTGSTQSVKAVDLKASAKIGGILFVGHSVYTHLSTLANSDDVRYSSTQLQAALVELKDALLSVNPSAVKTALENLYTEVNYYYLDGLCGHRSSVGSLKTDPNGNYHPTIAAKGVYGAITDRMPHVVGALAYLNLVFGTSVEKTHALAWLKFNFLADTVSKVRNRLPQVNL